MVLHRDEIEDHVAEAGFSCCHCRLRIRMDGPGAEAPVKAGYPVGTRRCTRKSDRHDHYFGAGHGISTCVAALSGSRALLRPAGVRALAVSTANPATVCMCVPRTWSRQEPPSSPTTT